jgi:hypothetical protein
MAAPRTSSLFDVSSDIIQRAREILVVAETVDASHRLKLVEAAQALLRDADNISSVAQHIEQRARS